MTASEQASARQRRGYGPAGATTTEGEDMDTLDRTPMRADTALDVPLIDWPADSARRDALAAARLPRLLLVAEGHPPPERWDVLEDWVRAPADASEALARQATLRRRAGAKAPVPYLDEHGLLWFGARWVPIPPSQVAIMDELLNQIGRLVSMGELRDAHAESGGNPASSAMKAVMARLGRRVSEIGLRLHNIRGRGYLLEVTSRSSED